MRDAAYEFGLRAAAVDAAVPQPQVIGQKLRHAALADAVEDHQRLLLGTGQHGVAALGARRDQAEPAAPFRLLVGIAGLREIGRHRMTLADLGDLGLEAGLDHVARRCAGQDGAERCAIERALGRENRADRDEQRAAALHVFGDVAEVVARDQVPRLVAVEDDQIEFLELLLEQLAHREDDQRQFAHRREIVLLRRAQDGEVHEIDRGVALQQVPPRPLALVGLARDQQHAQPVAHAVDGEERAVVVEGELVLAGADFQLDDVGAGVADGDRQLDRAADRHVDALHDLAADRQRHRRGAAGGIVDAELGDDVAADHAEARRLFQHDQPVAFVLLAGDQRMHGRAAQLRRHAGRHVMDLAVAQENDAGQSLRRNLDQRRAHRVDQARAARPLAAQLDLRRRQHDLAHFQAVLLAELALQRLARGLDLLAAFADRHGIAVVDDDQRHVGDGLALLLDQRGIGQRRQHDDERAQPPDRAARARAQTEQDKNESDRAQHGQHRPRQQRIEGDRDGRCHVHRLNLCMMSGR